MGVREEGVEKGDTREQANMGEGGGVKHARTHARTSYHLKYCVQSQPAYSLSKESSYQMPSL